MKQILVIACAAVAVTVPASAAGVQQMSAVDSEFMSQYEPSGETVECLNSREITSIEAVTDTTFLVKVGLHQYYLSEATAGCSGASHWGTRIEYVKRQTRLCSSQIIKVVDNTTGAMLGSCTLGSFEKMKKKSTDGDSPA